MSFDGKVHIRWYYDGILNASYNCLDRHLAKRGDQTAIIWEGDNPAEDAKITYRDLHDAGLQARQRDEEPTACEGRPSSPSTCR